MTPDSRIPKRRLDARMRRIRDVTLVAGPAQAVELTGVAADLWTLIDGQMSVADLGAAIAAEYDVDYEQAASDIGEFLAELAQIGAIEWSVPVAD